MRPASFREEHPVRTLPAASLQALLLPFIEGRAPPPQLRQRHVDRLRPGDHLQGEGHGNRAHLRIALSDQLGADVHGQQAQARISNGHFRRRSSHGEASLRSPGESPHVSTACGRPVAAVSARNVACGWTLGRPPHRQTPGRSLPRAPQNQQDGQDHRRRAKNLASSGDGSQTGAPGREGKRRRTFLQTIRPSAAAPRWLRW